MKTWTAALALMSCLAVTGCGSGALNGPASSSDGEAAADSGSSPSSSGGDGEVAGGGDGEVAGGGGDPARPSTGPTRKTQYEFTLPVGETSVDVNEGDVYAALSEGRCDDAQALLDSTQGNFRTQQTVPLFQAGVHLCRGDRAAAKAAYARAVYANEENVWFICALDRAVGSVVRGRPKSVLGTCPPVIPRTSTPEPDSSPETSPETSPDSSPESSAEASPESSSESSSESSPDPESSSDTESSSESESSPDSGSSSESGSGESSESTTGTGSGQGSDPSSGSDSG
ncbi:hypothetical protein FXF51_27885 [Nonomuraea sp. PA05]|uniref:hypothetical protein n=1 Tax=Nonomuraea sp. PA05 TaxID=2604466 RepID=UPI0011D668EE|nr:hypothetical protein [Nonomuraea sp. PA05]TYB61886.1 hypothetical protein FXF51_27885 [Nonomuraea sp. PA05]